MVADWMERNCGIFHFDGTTVGRRFLGSKFENEDANDTFQENVNKQKTNNDFITQLLNYCITHSKRSKTKAYQHVEVSTISSIEVPNSCTHDEFIKSIESTYVYTVILAIGVGFVYAIRRRDVYGTPLRSKDTEQVSYTPARTDDLEELRKGIICDGIEYTFELRFFSTSTTV
ncbi:unnamed protein product [Mytilus coruscus]|uniref:Uncharacterized protein n=1 Tax=Mytilus coruscus TaxID=42192 RepID=A0A6J8DR12_MYTCO|nr:unnamed protein product [Mytilus coruscus]